MFALGLVASLVLLFAVTIWAPTREWRKNDAALSAALGRLAVGPESEAEEVTLLGAIVGRPNAFTGRGQQLFR